MTDTERIDKLEANMEWLVSNLTSTIEEHKKLTDLVASTNTHIEKLWNEIQKIYVELGRIDDMATNTPVAVNNALATAQKYLIDEYQLKTKV